MHGRPDISRECWLRLHLEPFWLAGGSRTAAVGAALLPHTSWHATKVMSWTAHQRQFQVSYLSTS